MDTTIHLTPVYAELPKPAHVLHTTVFIEDVEIPVYTEEQMQAHADATHTLRTHGADFIFVRAEDLRALLARTAPPEGKGSNG